MPGRCQVQMFLLPVQFPVTFGEQTLHLCSGLGMYSRHHMAVGVERQGDGAVAEHLLDDLGVNAALEQLGCSGVAWVVDANPR